MTSAMCPCGLERATCDYHAETGGRLVFGVVKEGAGAFVLADHGSGHVSCDAPKVIFPQGFSTEDSSAYAGDMPLDVDSIWRASRILRENGVTGRRRFECSPQQAWQLFSDPFYARARDRRGDSDDDTYMATLVDVDVYVDETRDRPQPNKNNVPIYTASMTAGNFLIGRGQEILVRTS